MQKQRKMGKNKAPPCDNYELALESVQNSQRSRLFILAYLKTLLKRWPLVPKMGWLHCLEFQISLTSPTHISTKFTMARM